MKLVPILWLVLNQRFNIAMKFYFGWQARLPILIVTRKQLHNFAHEFCDHAVYETAKAFHTRSGINSTDSGEIIPERVHKDDSSEIVTERVQDAFERLQCKQKPYPGKEGGGDE